MVQQLRKHEREAWRAEQYGRQMFALDRENQGDNSERDRKVRERVVVYRAIDALWAAGHREQP